MLTQTSSLQVIEKHSGSLRREVANLTNQQFHTLEVDARHGKIEFISPLEKITIALENNPPEASISTP